MRTRRLIAFCGCLLSLTGIRAQSPGGIGTSNLMVWLKGDAGISTGSTFTWSDQSTQGRNATQTVAADQPTVTGAADYMNYNPGVKFASGGSSSTSQWLIMANGQNNAGTNANEFFLVYKKLAGPLDGFVLGTNVPGNRSYFYSSGVIQYGNSNKPTVISPGFVNNGSNILVGKFFSSTDAAQAANGATFAALSPLSAPAAFSTPTALSVQPTNSGGYNAFPFAGNTMEIIGYNAEIDLTGTNRQQIESYLALKYGISLDSAGTGGHYYNSAGSSVYQGGGGFSSFNNIIGIARDDQTTLNQRQSHLANDSVRLYMGATPLATSLNSSNGGSFTADKAYIVMGDNLGNLCTTGTHIAAKPSPVLQRLDREWKIMYNRTVDVFNMDITLAPCAPYSSGSGTATVLELLYSTSADLTTGSVMANNTNGMSIILSSGGVVTISGLNNALAAIAPAVSTGTTVYFTLASSQYYVLPLQLTNFLAKAATGSVQLFWTTTDETDVSYFEVIRSTDNKNWEPIGRVAALGEPSPVNPSDNYHFTDTLPLTGTGYYRLQIFRADGSSSYSTVQVVGLPQASAPAISVFPNPSHDQVFVQYPGQTLTASAIRIYSVTGELLPVPVTGGTGTATIQMSGLAQGVYFVQVKGSTGWQVFRVLKN